jgi:hypothetical protein
MDEDFWPCCATCGDPKVWRAKRTMRAGGYWKCRHGCPQKRGPKPRTRTTPGTCDTCGREKVWKGDTRRAEGGYWTCDHGRPSKSKPRGPRAPRQPREAGAPRPRAPRAAPAPAVNQDWMHDPRLRCCPREGCYATAGTCGH